MGDRFEVCRGFDGALTSAEPVVDGLLTKTCLGVVMGQQLGLGCYYFGKLRFQCRSNGRVKLLTAGPQQSCVGGVLHQRMLEQV